MGVSFGSMVLTAEHFATPLEMRLRETHGGFTIAGMVQASTVNPSTFFKIFFVYSLGALPPIERLVAGKIGVLLTIEL